MSFFIIPEYLIPAIFAFSVIIFGYLIYAMSRDVLKLDLGWFEKILTIIGIVFIPPIGFIAWFFLYYVFLTPDKNTEFKENT